MQKKSADALPSRAAPLLRFIAYQMVWWLLVYSVKLEEISHVRELSNLLALTVSIVSLNLILNRKRNTKARRYLLLLVAVGFAVDTIWVCLGYIETKPIFEIAGALKLAPPWLFAIWISFAAMCIVSMTVESKSLFSTAKKKFLTLAAMILAGAVGGPLSYMVGEPIGVLVLQHRPVSTVLIAVEWAIMFPVILVAGWFVRAQDAQRE